MNINQIIASELGVQENQISAAIELLDEGATVPFIARYRKEATGGLDDTQLRTLAERLQYLRELLDRKATVLKSIEEQGKLTPELQAAIDQCDNKTALEDLYLPYKPKRRTKAQIARENGLQDLADAIFRQPENDPEALAAPFINEQVPDIKAALDGARAILIEQFAEDAELIGALREKLWNEAQVHAQVIAGKEESGEKFKDYFDYREPIRAMPSHRALAVLRGRNEEILTVSLKYQPDETPITEQSDYEKIIVNHFQIANENKWLRDTVRLTWKAKIFLSLELEAFSKLKELADTDAITVFAKNLKDLLLAAPAGRLPTLGLDPGYRNGVKCAVVDDTGKLVDTVIVYLHQENKMLADLSRMIKQHNVKLIAIGNGTASRETDKIAGEIVKMLPENGLHKIVVSEAGASIYSASELAAAEFPDLDVSLRGAVSIARRLQDPLAELVKIDPKSIGVGQYQHDVNQSQLAKSLDAVVEDCVNAVGVDVNTASAPLLARISGLNQTLAKNIVAYRDENGAFKSRKALMKVPRLGAKTFEQAAGFLRINGGTEPLDASAVHPEAYSVVEKMLAQQGISAAELIGNCEKVSQIKATDFIDERFGLPTIMDILAELEKPARDPRGEFKMASFTEGVNEISDLEVGMILEGVVSNVANFGAFVDIGVHQDGLVHISMLSNKFVADPRDVVKAGDVVKVKVIEVDAARKRIALTMRLEEEKQPAKSVTQTEKRHDKPRNSKPQREKQPTNSAMADAFEKLKR
ncbi:Tex family protein [Kingella kingae]|uniref:Tex family protein n=2 Tax=Kingella kingae TaxID=504 RepID=UPI000408B92D|nr:Tex family protein [Kingella kingae]MBD3613432.1 RNA-binding transcriptional accessory protein [Kingella kingae]MBD3631901.1 RNA-binding transcriptional accessory protein [Kingella kingae]MBD3659172.1 RNA-binding transcriptional accessory protein [Kingella kingae]MDK4586834.1 Tex family protein [Kingella kingae]MDK4604846.1 Tex family protein [Kingella kingae]